PPSHTPSPCPPCAVVACVVEPQEGLEHILSQARRYARAVIIHRHGEIAVIAVAGDRNRRREACRVGNQVAEATLECRRPHCDDWWAMKDDACLVGVTFRVEPQLLKRLRHIRW